MKEQEASNQATAEESASQNQSDIFIARQPIFDNDLRVFGYELLFRDSMENKARIAPGTAAADKASSQAVINAIMELDLERLVDGKRAYFNLTRKLLLAGADLPFSSTNVGVEILEDIEIDDESVAAVEQLSLMDFSIALDDFDWRPGVERLLDLVDMIKIDILAQDRDRICAMIERLRPYKASLVAEKVETREQYEMCRELGFDYYQGFFLCRPTVVSAKRLPESRLNVLRLITKLQDPEITPDEVEAIIKNDVALNYRLLRTVNSAYYGLSVTIRSVSHAVVYLGMPAVRNWANLLLLAGIEDRPNELIRLALIRARMCELLTHDKPRETRDAAFTVGLFSMLDALLDIPMAEITSKLPLDEDLQLALSEQDGPYGRLLQTVVHCERGEWDQIQSGLFTTDQLMSSYLEALDWSHDHYRALKSSSKPD
jgi:c-di-GMP phosphodiesterase